MLPLNIDRKPYTCMGSPMTVSNLTLSDLERSKSRSMSKSLTFPSLIFRKGAQLGPMLLLIINRKPCMGSTMTASHLTLNDLEKSRSLGFQSLITRKGDRVRPYVTINHQ